MFVDGPTWKGKAHGQMSNLLWVMACPMMLLLLRRRRMDENENENENEHDDIILPK